MIASETSVRINGHEFTQLLSSTKIRRIVQRMGREISEHYKDVKTLHIVVVLSGAAVFAMDLIRELSVPCRLHFIRASSYSGTMNSNGQPEFDIPEMDMQGEHVLVLEDLIDTGTTIIELTKRLKTWRAASLRIAALLAKPEVMSTDVSLAFCGLTIPPVFVVGYGMDFGEMGRELPHIYQLHIAMNEEKQWE